MIARSAAAAGASVQAPGTRKWSTDINRLTGPSNAAHAACDSCGATRTLSMPFASPKVAAVNGRHDAIEDHTRRNSVVVLRPLNSARQVLGLRLGTVWTVSSARPMSTTMPSGRVPAELGVHDSRAI